MWKPGQLQQELLNGHLVAPARFRRLAKTALGK